MPEPPFEDEKEKFSNDTKKTMDKAAAFLAKGEKEIEAILAKKALSKADKEKIVGYLHEAYRKLTDSLPFIADQMQERFDKIVAKAGIEVEAHMNRLIGHMGLKSLTGIEPPIRFLDTAKKTALPAHGPGKCGCDYTEGDKSNPCECCGAAPNTPCPK
jgi:hypothetical protein